MSTFALRAALAVGAAVVLLGGPSAPGSAWALGPKSGQPPTRNEDPNGPKQGPDALLEQVGVDQRLGESLPLDLTLTDSTGVERRLGDLVGERPVILSLVYYECPMLCTMVLNGMLRVMNVLRFDAGKEFDVITVSIDPRETPALAADKKAIYLDRYRRETADEGWHFLVGDQAAIARLADAVGFSYAYDETTDQFAHGSAIVVATPEGRIAKYFYGIDYSPVDVRLALVEAANERIGSLTDAILLSCFQYDPLTGKYSLVVMRVIRWLGAATVLGLLAFIVMQTRRDRRRSSGASGPTSRDRATAPVPTTRDRATGPGRGEVGEARG